MGIKNITCIHTDLTYLLIMDTNTHLAYEE